MLIGILKLFTDTLLPQDRKPLVGRGKYFVLLCLMFQAKMAFFVFCVVFFWYLFFTESNCHFTQWRLRLFQPLWGPTAPLLLQPWVFLWPLSGVWQDYCCKDHTWLICIQFKLGRFQKKERSVDEPVDSQKGLVSLKGKERAGGFSLFVTVSALESLGWGCWSLYLFCVFICLKVFFILQFNDFFKISLKNSKCK